MKSIRTSAAALLVAVCALAASACDDGAPADPATADATDAQISDTRADTSDGTTPDAADTVEVGDTSAPADTADATATGDSVDAADLVDVDAADMTACVARACTPTMCASHDDGCGSTLDCGPCADDASVAEHMVVVDALIATMTDRSYMTDILPDLDPAALRTDVEAVLRARPANDAALLEALHTVIQAFANGHSAVYSTTQYCAALGGGDAGATRYDACARPLDDDFVVTTAGSASPLGLEAGDRIVAVNGARGTDMVDAVMASPLCGNGAGNAETRREMAAVSVFAALEEGDVIEVAALDGSVRQVAVPAPLPVNRTTSCRDPLGRDTQFVARATLRADGVAVIQIPRLVFLYGDPRADLPIDQYLDALTEEVGQAFDSVVDEATAIVWDVRSNIGGASPVGFAVTAGMPGFVADTPIARCTTRIPDSDPIDYWVGGPDYDLAANDRFAFDGPTALLIDGLSISAADYFARAVDLGTDALIVGRPTAGAWGGGGATLPLHEPLDLFVGYDPYRCNDLIGNALETRSVVPDIQVEYAPVDLAAGRDTVLETAVAELLAP